MADYDNHNEDLVERYLLNRLSEEEMVEFQARMLYDTRLRMEVRVMRALQKSLVAARAPSGKNSRLQWRWILLTGVALVLAGLLIYRIGTAGKEKTENQSAPLPPEMPVQVPAQDNIPIKAAPEKSVPAPLPIASNLIPNPALERYVNSSIRGGNEHFDIALSSAGGPFKRKAGKIIFHLSGASDAKDKVPDYPMNVFIYSNKKEEYENAQPQWEQKISLKKEGGQVRFEVAELVALQPGLYYFLVENETSGEVLKAGKFTVE